MHDLHDLFPRITVTRGGITYPPVPPESPTERAAREAVQAYITRMVGTLVEAQNAAIDYACVVALHHGWDIHLHDPWRSKPSRFIGISFTPASHRVPTIHWRRDDADLWEDED